MACHKKGSANFASSNRHTSHEATLDPPPASGVSRPCCRPQRVKRHIEPVLINHEQD